MARGPQGHPGAGCAAMGAGHAEMDCTAALQLLPLMDLPAQLSTVSEREVLRVTALKIAQVFSAVAYIRWGPGWQHLVV